MPRGEGGNGKGYGSGLLNRGWMSMGINGLDGKKQEATANSYRDKYGVVDRGAWERAINSMPDTSIGTRRVEVQRPDDGRERSFNRTATYRDEEYTIDNRPLKAARIESMNSWFSKNSHNQKMLNMQVLTSNMTNDNTANVQKDTVNTDANDNNSSVEITGASGKRKKATGTMSTSLGV